MKIIAVCQVVPT